MILLDTTTRKLQVVLNAAKTTNDCPWITSYVDIASTAAGIGASSNGVSNGLTAVDIIGVPGASATRKVLEISLYNADTVATTVTINYDDNGTTRVLWYGSLNTGDALHYCDEQGFYVMDNGGNRKIIQTSSVAPAIAGSCYRLSPSTGVYVPTSDVTSATTLYAVPGNGKFEWVYDPASSTWKPYQASQLSLSLGGYTASSCYDIFEYVSSGALALSSTIWTSSGAGTSTRATALVYQDGVLCKSGALGYKYLGTIYINSSGGQIDLVFTSTSRAPVCGIWNYYNRQDASLLRYDPTAAWSYATYSTWRQADASNVGTLNRCDIVVGMMEDKIDATTTTFISSNADGVLTGVGVDSTTSYSGQIPFNTAAGSMSAFYSGRVTPGLHQINLLEQVGPGGVAGSFQGYSSGLSVYLTSLKVNFKF